MDILKIFSGRKAWWGHKETNEEEKKELAELLAELLQAKRELMVATQGFNLADTEEKTDMYTYQIIAAQRKCDLLYRKARQGGFKYEALVRDSIRAVDM